MPESRPKGIAKGITKGISSQKRQKVSPGVSRNTLPDKAL
jgi:hypothetical protein